LLARLAGLKPHVGAWYLAAFCAALLPLMQTLLWRSFGLRGNVIALAAGFVVANYYVPNNIFSWGGFGQIIGLSLLPWVLVMVRSLVMRPGWPAGVAVGLALVALTHVHTAEVFLVPFFMFAAWPARGDRAPVGAFLRAGGVALGTLVVAGLLPLLPSFLEYSKITAHRHLATSPGWQRAWFEFRTFSGGNVPKLGQLVLPGLLIGLVLRTTRRIAILAIVFAYVFFGLRQIHDPLSLTIGQIFYQQSSRAAYAEIFLVAPLLAAGVFAIIDLIGKAWDRLSWRGFTAVELGILVLVTMMWLYPGIYWNYRNLENKHHVVPFSLADARLAAQMAVDLPPGARVANQDNDGSFWAMYISGMEFLDPCTWNLGIKEGRSHRDAVSHLLDDPWPPGTLALRDLGTEYLFVSDTALRDSRHPLTREKIDADPRFRSLFRGGDSAVYEVLWSVGE
jgi:hypothetical protein